MAQQIRPDLHGKQLSLAERAVIYGSHATLQWLKRKAAAAFSVEALKGVKVASLTAERWGTSAATVHRVTREVGNSNFNVSPPAPSGRPPFRISDQYRSHMRGLVVEYANKRKPLTIPTIRKRLEEDHDLKVSRETVRTSVCRFGLKILHLSKNTTVTEGREKLGVVQYRIEYAKWAAKHIRSVGKRGDKYKALVVLDESYCNLNHSSKWTWSLDDNSIVHATGAGRGRLLCIIGAGIYYRSGGHEKAGWVPGSFHCWDSKSTGRGRGRPRKDAPPPPVSDYHGHFNADKFEKWFESICKTVREKYGKSCIIMDGARYHKRRIDKIPTASSKKQEMLDWMASEEIDIPPKNTKKILYEIIKLYKPDKVRYRTCEIANEYGHFVKYTPPYHPELQPIEKIWGNIKNKIAADPVTKGGMPELKRRIEEGKDDIEQRHWMAFRRLATEKEDLYKKQVLDVDEDSEEEEDEEETDDEYAEVLIG